jgi:LAO/AO transport system kinase
VDPDLIKKICAFDDRTIARAASLIEDRSTGYLDLLQSLYPLTGKAKIIGITGAPGSGKSTLINSLVLELTKKSQSVAVIAVDPSSPITDGAVLGDRIRMKAASEKQKVFVRSISSRGQRGGISLALADLIDLFDAAGFNYVIVETVGVGQVEVDIRNLVDLLLLVMTPGMGDEVQALKAGILEVADVFVINKSDLAGADILNAILRSTLPASKEWVDQDNIIKTVATSAEGVYDLLTQIEGYFLRASTIRIEQRIKTLADKRILDEALLIISDLLVSSKLSAERLTLLDQCASKQLHPGLAAKSILKSLGIK